MNGATAVKKVRGKRPTRRQKELMKNHRLAPDNWLVVEVDEEEKSIQFYNKQSQKFKILIFA
ncbi:DUF6906 family protein [Paenibacillus graminis]|uniref:DUF6906 family protein n=1 Tax=Paenibacillus graminis TaxID=189425 RepID=UPI002DB9126D|nr:hypothetical protein [Paenibacillus graminis]MEC0167407.1 hypothetical protein [Paenibacillus graminis]